MNRIDLKFSWTFSGPLHVGTGMSRIGGADRLIRLSGDTPYIPGEAVKGAVRGAAERLAHWLTPPDAPAEAPRRDTDSTPRHPVLRRIFAPASAWSGAAYYRFNPAKLSLETETIELASTAINHDTGAALRHTLRLVQAVSAGACFKGAITAYAEDWSTPECQADLMFLCAALAATDAVGGKKGAGYGQVACVIQECGAGQGKVVDWCDLGKTCTIEMLQRHMSGTPAGGRP
jgi:CRISPR/Cas system CSM-associated protein Csm3 (group 7 of RAMP superfamily)